MEIHEAKWNALLFQIWKYPWVNPTSTNYNQYHSSISDVNTQNVIFKVPNIKKCNFEV